MQHKPKAQSEPALPARAWQRMLSGRRLDLLDPSPLDIEIGDIAHGLARLARWNGQTKGAHAFSVAQHCVLVEAIAAALKPELSDKFRLAALLHDAPEYVVGDLISPFKAAMGAVYKPFEERIQRAIHIRFGLPPELPSGVAQLIKKADKIAAYYEATQLAGFSLADARQFFGDPGRAQRDDAGERREDRAAGHGGGAGRLSRRGSRRWKAKAPWRPRLPGDRPRLPAVAPDGAMNRPSRPSPSPLPWERGRTSAPVERTFPLPWGEGQGEGSDACSLRPQDNPASQMPQALSGIVTDACGCYDPG